MHEDEDEDEEKIEDEVDAIVKGISRDGEKATESETKAEAQEKVKMNLRVDLPGMGQEAPEDEPFEVYAEMDELGIDPLLSFPPSHPPVIPKRQPPSRTKFSVDKAVMDGNAVPIGFSDMRQAVARARSIQMEEERLAVVKARKSSSGHRKEAKGQLCRCKLLHRQHWAKGMLLARPPPAPGPPAQWSASFRGEWIRFEQRGERESRDGA